jgi:hypothetical protein
LFTFTRHLRTTALGVPGYSQSRLPALKSSYLGYFQLGGAHFEGDSSRMFNRRVPIRDAQVPPWRSQCPQSYIAKMAML